MTAESTVPAPDPSSLRAIADAYGFNLTDAEQGQYLEQVTTFLRSWDVVESLYARIVPTTPDRRWSRPSEADNPWGAWYVTSEICESTVGPLVGRRVAIKDNTAVGGVPMMNGSRTVEGFTPRADATVVSRLLGAGATIAGKAVCEDLSMSGGSHTSKPAPVLNPWDVTRSAGGSSSGSSVLVATGEVDLAISGDQAGSIRIPAAFLGVVGHKPTWGLVPYTGAMSMEPTLDHLGPTARTTADAALMLTVIAGADGLDPRQPRDIVKVDYLAELAKSPKELRIGVLAEGFAHPDSEPEVDRVVRAAVEQLRSTGMHVSDVSVPWHRDAGAVYSVLVYEGLLPYLVDGNGYGAGWKGQYDPDLADFYGSSWRRDPNQFPETVKLAILIANHARNVGHGRHYAMARNLERSLSAAYDAVLSEVDVLVMPTSPVRATPLPSHDASLSEVLVRGTEMFANTAPFNITGHPACSVPAGLAGGLPVGMMIVGRKFDDATVLRAAQAWETAAGGFPTLPQMTRTGA